MFKNLRSLPTLSDLVAELNRQPSLSFILGLKPRTKVLPVVGFYSFLRDIENLWFQKIRESIKYLLNQMIKLLSNLRKLRQYDKQFHRQLSLPRLEFDQFFLVERGMDPVLK